MLDELSPLEKVQGFLDPHQVEYIVIGGQAEWLMGSPRATFDVDICYKRSLDNLQKLLLALRDLNVSLRGAPRDLPFKLDLRTLQFGCNFTFDSEIGALDLLGVVEPIGEFEAVAARAETFQLADKVVRVISLDDLIRVKRHINRPKDRESLYQLLAIKRVREESGDR